MDLNKMSRLVLSVAGGSVLAISSTSFAQDVAPQGAEASAAGAGLEEVIVSAQRRAESMQRVPIAITALTAADLESSGVTSTIELLAATPGLVLNRQVRGGAPFIRGVGSQDTTMGNEVGVAMYVDGVYIMDVTANIFSFNNIERVETLKGPQGTLFGRNATGGLIHVITRDPEVDPRVEGSFSYGDYETSEVSLYATGGAGDVAADVAFYAIRQDEGYGVNLANGDEVNINRDTAVRTKILWTPTDEDSFTLALDWNKNQTTMGFTRNSLPGSLLFGGVPFRGSPYDTPGIQTPTHPEADNRGVSLRYEHDFSWGTFSALSAYRKSRTRVLYDQDLVTPQLADIDVTQDSHSWQNEFLLVGSTKSLDWTAGVFLFQGQAGFDPLRIRSIAPANNYELFSTAELESYAVFGQATYTFAERTGLTVGVRHTTDERAVAGERFALPAGTLAATRIDEVKYSEPTWRLALEHEFSDAVLAYVSYNRGFKSGLFIVSEFTAPPVNPETIDAYEIGLKTDLFNRTLRVNASAFHYNYKDIQLSRLPPGGGAAQLFNAAEGEINGFELETSWFVPMDHGRLQLNASASVLDTEYTSFPNAPVTTPNPAGGNILTFADVSGNNMIRAPEWTASASADYTIPVGPGELGLNLSYYHNDGFFWEADNRIEQEPYDLINAQIGYSFGQDLRYRVRVWGRNLADEPYYSYVATSGLGDLAQASPPRIYGVTFDFAF